MTKKNKTWWVDMEPHSLYEKEVTDFLRIFDLPYPDLIKIWQAKGRFLAPDELVQAIIEYKKPSEKAAEPLKQIAAASVSHDCRTGTFGRMDFMYGLADLYAKEVDPTTSLVEFDIGNCNGAGQWLGQDRLNKVFTFANQAFIKNLKNNGAKFAFTFDNAKNDDFKIITGGASTEQMEIALEQAQKEVNEFFVFAADMPHTKYKDMPGIGVGSAFQRLGKGLGIDIIQRTLNQFVDARKANDFKRRQLIKQSHEKRKPLTPEAVCLLADEALKDIQTDVSNSADPLHIVDNDNLPSNPKIARRKLAQDMADKNAFTEQDRLILGQMLNFYDQKDSLTGAARDDFLLEDIQYFAKKTGKPITVANLKLENCAGVNKMLSHAHSIVMTRDYVDLMQKYLDASVMDVEESYIYYVGRNAFNIVFPHASPEQAEELLSERFDAYIDRQINQKPIIEYFEKNGMPVPPEITNESILMGDIPNLRGLGNGIRTINLLTTAFDASVTNKDLTSFHRKAIGNDQSIIDQFNMNTLDLISPEIFNEEQIPAITALYKKAVGGLKNDQ